MRIPLWLTMLHCTTVQVTPQVVASDGTLSAAGGGAISLVGVVDEITPEFSLMEENITGAHRIRANYVELEMDATLDITEILKYNSVNVLPYVFFASAYCEWVFVRGAQTFQMVLKRRRIRETWRKGKSVVVYTAGMVDDFDAGFNQPGVVQPSYS